MSNTFLLPQLLAESSRQFPDAAAVCCGTDTLSYTQLDTLSGKIAATLRNDGIGTGDRIGIYMMKSVESVAAMFGILKAGAVYVPIDWFAPVARIEFIIRNCAMKALVSSTPGINKIAAEKTSPEPLISLCVNVFPQSDGAAVSMVATTTLSRDDVEKLAPLPPRTLGIVDTDLAYILYTSGSTGNPKGVMLSHRNALTFVETAADFFAISSKDRLVSHAPLHFDLSVFDVYCAIRTGACVVLLTEKETVFPAAVIAAIARYGITIWNSVPSALIQLVLRSTLDEAALSSLRLVLFAGELFPLKFLEKLMAKLPHAEFYNMYGQTEANSSTYYKIESTPMPDDPPLPIGKPFPNFDVFGVDDNGALLSKAGDRGELFVRAATIALGYWREAEKTASSFVVNPLRPDYPEIVYKTGDIVSLDERGNFVYIGRKDSMVKCRGFRVDLGEIESTLSKFPAIAEAAVVPVPDDEIGNRLICFIIPSPGETVSPEEIRDFCSQKIPRYMVPEKIVISTEFPRTSTGKVDKRKLSAALT